MMCSFGRGIPGFSEGAVHLVIAALNEAMAGDPERAGHLGAPRLTAAVVAAARSLWGGSAPRRLWRHGLRSGAALGRLVFALAERGWLVARPEGDEASFAAVPALDELTFGLDREARFDCPTCGWPLVFPAERRGLVDCCTACWAYVDVPD